MPPHAVLTGTITFGLVSVPVKLYAATKPQHITFHLLHAADAARLRQQYVCAKDGAVVERRDTIKGYEYAKDQYVLLSAHELKAIEESADQTVDIQEFVPIEQVDPIYFEKTYLVGPDKGGQKGYRLLCEAMRRAGKGALAKFVMRGRQQLVLLREARGGLMLHGLYYADEVRTFEGVDLGAAVTPTAKELDLAVQLVEQFAAPGFDPTKYADEYRGKLLRVIEEKVAGRQVVIAPPAPRRAQVIDLMEALKASLASRQPAGKKGASAAARKPARAKRRAAAPRKAAKGT